MKSLVFVLASLCYSLPSGALHISVGLYSNIESKDIMLIAGKNNYRIFGDGNFIALLTEGQSFQATINEEKLLVKKGTKVIGHYTTVTCLATADSGFFRIRSIEPQTKAWPFYGNMKFIYSENKIKLINVVELEKYVAAVVESEAGGYRNTEFLKAQAIISRTYALAHLSRHKKEGFNLCDQVHCQAYGARNRFNELIRAAVIESKNMVLVSPGNRLITAPYHSNCGGQTAPASDVWLIGKSYLKSVVDTFCINSSRASWQKKISKYDWIEYLLSEGISKDSLLLNSDFTFIQSKRMVHYQYASYIIPLRKIRTEFKLNSTWFNIKPESDSLLFYGYGFGHGVGLCQQGAFVKAEAGYTAQQILRYYFSDISIANYLRLKQK